MDQWRLVADDSGALIDPGHPGLRGYPNPGEVPYLDITLYSGGKVCASDGAHDWCGGPVQGIPYLVRGQVRSSQLCLRVVDIFHQQVAEHCGAGTVSGADTVEPACHEATTAAGAPCEVCTGEDGAVVSNTCTAGGDIGGPDTTCADPHVAVRTGTDLFIAAFNRSLERAGIDAVLEAPPESELMDFDEGDISLGAPSCADVLDYLDDEFSDDHEGTEDWAFGRLAKAECQYTGRCRIGQIVTRSMADACAAIPAGCNLQRVSLGIVGSGGYAVTSACPGDQQLSEFSAVDDCVGSPLVIDLDGDGIELVGPDRGPTFALMGGDAVRVGWVAGGDDALLAVDVDGDGAITSGWELFGEATGGGAADGFAALARRDADGNGTVDGAELDGLLAWVDDGDAVSEPGELLDLPALGIVSLSLDRRHAGMTDPSGAELGDTGRVGFEDGSARPLVDVWFEIGG